MARCCSAFATQAVALPSLHERQPVRAFSHPLVAPHMVVAARVRSQQQGWKLASRTLSQSGRDKPGKDRSGGDRKVLQQSSRGPFNIDDGSAWLHRQEMRLLHRTSKRKALEIAKGLLIKEGLDIDIVDDLAFTLVEAHHDAVAAGSKVFDIDVPFMALTECGLSDWSAMAVVVDYVDEIVKKEGPWDLSAKLRKIVAPPRAADSSSFKLSANFVPPVGKLAGSIAGTICRRKPSALDEERNA